jgi:hypothetical protein
MGMTLPSGSAELADPTLAMGTPWMAESIKFLFAQLLETGGSVLATGKLRCTCDILQRQKHDVTFFGVTMATSKVASR